MSETDCTSVVIPWVFSITFTPEPNGSGKYVLAARSVVCDGNTVNNAAMSTSSVALMTAALTADPATSALGTYTTSGATIIYRGECETLSLPWVVS